MLETWVAIHGWPTYEISDHGNVRRTSGGRWMSSSGKNRKFNIDKVGYHFVTLRHDGRASKRSVHSLVAEAFLGPKPTPKHQVAHLDGNRANNHVSNIAWVTAKENASHKHIHGTMARGERQGSSKLTEEAVQAIRSKQEWKRGDTTNIAERYGVSTSLVYQVRQSKWWKHLA